MFASTLDYSDGSLARRPTARTLIRRTNSRWFHAQTINACHHGPGTNESWEIYQLRQEIEHNQIRIHQRRHSNILCCLSCATSAIQANEIVRIAGSLPLRQNSSASTSGEQRIPRSKHAVRGPHRGRTDERRKQSTTSRNFFNQEAENNHKIGPLNPGISRTPALGTSVNLAKAPGQRTPMHKRPTPPRQITLGPTRSWEGQAWIISERLVFDTQVLNHSSREGLSGQNQTRKFRSPSHGGRTLTHRGLSTLPHWMAPCRTSQRPTIQPATNSWKQCRVQAEKVPRSPVSRETSNGGSTKVAAAATSPSVDVPITKRDNDANKPTAANADNTHVANDGTNASTNAPAISPSSSCTPSTAITANTRLDTLQSQLSSGRY